MSDPTDRELIGLFCTDKEKAFELFFHRYYMRLCIYSVQITDDFIESEDIVQNFFVSFWEKKLYLTITDNLKGYAYLCVRNSSLKFIRKNGKNPSESILPGEEDFLFVCENLDDNERERQMEALEKAMKTLPEQEQKAVCGVVLDNKKYKTVAGEMQISINTLKTHLSRAMKKLRKT